MRCILDDSYTIYFALKCHGVVPYFGPVMNTEHLHIQRSHWLEVIMDDDMCGCSQLHLLVFSQEQHTEVKGSFDKQVHMHAYVH